MMRNRFDTIIKGLDMEARHNLRTACKNSEIIQVQAITPTEFSLDALMSIIRKAVHDTEDEFVDEV